MSTSTITRTAAHDCSCGQDLDNSERAHCPRCGCQVARAA